MIALHEDAIEESPAASMPEYRLIEEFPAYRFGSDGSVWSCFGPTWKRLVQAKDKDGYCQVTLSTNKKIKTQKVHRLILTAFVGPCPPGMEACHFPDQSRSNNRIENLRWGTRASNAQDRLANGTDHRGEKSPNAKMTQNQVDEAIRRRATGERIVSIAKSLGVHRRTLSDVFNGKTWRPE
jgi:hypothetical protein